MVRELQDTKKTMDLGFEQSTGISLFAGGPVIKSDVDTRVSLLKFDTAQDVELWFRSVVRHQPLELWKMKATMRAIQVT